MRATPNAAGTPWLMIVMVVTAGLWTAALAFGSHAQGLFQSPISPLSPLSPLSPPATVGLTRTVPPTLTPFVRPIVPPARTVTATAPPTAFVPEALPLPPPTAAPRPASPEQLTATAVAAQFLPAPTLTSPDAVPAGGGPIGAAAPLSAPVVTPVRPTATPQPAGFDAGLAFTGGIRALGFVWLACGIAAVAGLLAAGVWLIRRQV